MFGVFLTCSCRDSTVLEIVKGFDKFRQLEVLLGLSQSPFCLILLHPRYPTEVLFVEILFVFVSNPVGVHLFHFLAKMLIIRTKHSNPMIFCTAVCTFSLKLSRRCMLRIRAAFWFVKCWILLRAFSSVANKPYQMKTEYLWCPNYKLIWIDWKISKEFWTAWMDFRLTRWWETKIILRSSMKRIWEKLT